MNYDFDTIIDRHGTHCKRTDNLASEFGSKDLLPLWIADMDFAVCPKISKALEQLRAAVARLKQQ